MSILRAISNFCIHIGQERADKVLANMELYYETREKNKW